MKLLHYLMSGITGMVLWTASAQAEVDFSGETITIVVPFGEGGGTS